MDWQDFPELKRRRKLPPPTVLALPKLPALPTLERGESPLAFVDPDPQKTW